MSAVFDLPLSVLAILALALFFGAAEAGYRFGDVVTRREAGDTEHPEIGTIAAAMLGLLALVIGFTFSMALSRFDARRGLVIEETNALSAAARLAHGLAEPETERITALLPGYVKLRLAFFDDGSNAARLATTYQETATLQARLFSEAAAAAARTPTARPRRSFCRPSIKLLRSKPQGGRPSKRRSRPACSGPCSSPPRSARACSAIPAGCTSAATP